MPDKKEHLEPLGNGVKIYVNEFYHFSTDTILLADFAKPKKNSKAVDLGTGCGTIPFLWSRNDTSVEISAVEIQSGAVNLAERSKEYNGSGIKNPDSEKLLARHEQSCTLEDIALAAKNLLQFGGRFCMCQRPERLTDVMEVMRNNNLEPKRLRFVQQRKDKKSKLFLIEGKRSSKKGNLVVEPTLFIEENGEFSPEMRGIYGSYKDGYDE